MTNQEYIHRLESKLQVLKPKGDKLLQDEREAYMKNDEVALRQIRKESDIIFKKIRQTEEDLMIARSI